MFCRIFWKNTRIISRNLEKLAVGHIKISGGTFLKKIRGTPQRQTNLWIFTVGAFRKIRGKRLWRISSNNSWVPDIGLRGALVEAPSRVAVVNSTTLPNKPRLSYTAWARLIIMLDILECSTKFAKQVQGTKKFWKKKMRKISVRIPRETSTGFQEGTSTRYLKERTMGKFYWRDFWNNSRRKF